MHQNFEDTIRAHCSTECFGENCSVVLGDD